MSREEKIIFFLPVFLPFLVIFTILPLSYLPYLLASKPKYDFLYSIKELHCVQFLYVKDKKVQTEAIENNVNNCSGGVKIYYHKVAENLSSELTIQEAKKYNLITNTYSPDNFYFDTRSLISGFITDVRSVDKHYLINNKNKLLFEQKIKNADIREELAFLGWVEKN